MRIFVTGASGWIGSAVTGELLADGHEVVGLARSDASAAALEQRNIAVHRGSLDDPDSLAKGADSADAVVHLAFKHDFSDHAGAGRTEHTAVQRMLDALEGSDRPFLIAAALANLADDRPATEEDPSPYHGADSMRGGSENLALSYADRGVRAVALRFAGTVHGMGDRGFVAELARIGRANGAVGYVGDGSSRWPAVHVSDAARLAVRALAAAPAGFRAHAVAEEGVPSRDIAAALGEQLGLPTVSIAPEEAMGYFGSIGGFLSLDIPASSARTRELLDWTPTGPTLLTDIAAGAYA